jgi:putative transposase
MKLVNQRKLKWCLVHYSKGETSSKWAAKHLGVSQRRFQQVYKQYQLTGIIPNIGLKVGRPKQENSQE